MKKIIKIISYAACVLGRCIPDGRARILMYHSFNKPGIFFNVKEEDFDWQMRYLKAKGYKFVLITDLVRHIRDRDNLSKLIAITFDDAHIDFAEVALPILKRENIPATLYWPTGLVLDQINTSSGIMCPILNLNCVKELSKKSQIEIGSHSVSHRELTSLSDIEVDTELNSSFDTVHSLTNKSVSFAYPRGKYTMEIVNKVKVSGYDSAVIVDEGSIDVDTSVFELPRFSIDSSTSRLAFKAKLSPVYNLILYIKSCTK